MAELSNRETDSACTHGIRANLGQFAFQMVQVFFVGLTIGLQRNVVPALAEEEFGLAPGSYLLFRYSRGFPTRATGPGPTTAAAGAGPG